MQRRVIVARGLGDRGYLCGTVLAGHGPGTREIVTRVVRREFGHRHRPGA